jgi:hypothetical protein
MHRLDRLRASVWGFNAQQQPVVILVNRDEYHITFDCAIVILESGC